MHPSLDQSTSRGKKMETVGPTLDQVHQASKTSLFVNRVGLQEEEVVVLLAGELMGYSLALHEELRNCKRDDLPSAHCKVGVVELRKRRAASTVDQRRSEEKP
jgi:hypothetical protein